MKRKLLAGVLVVVMLLIVSCGKNEEAPKGETPSENTTTPESGEPAATGEAKVDLPKHDTLVAEIGEKSVTKEQFEKGFLFQKFSLLKSYGENAFDGEQGKTLTQNLRNKVQQDLAREQLFVILAEEAGFKVDREKAEKAYEEQFLTKNTEETLKYFKDNGLDKDYVVSRIALENQIGAYIESVRNTVQESDSFKELKSTINLVRARHILVPEADEAKIKEIKEQLDQDPSRFEELAKEHSKDGSAQNGGDLGYFAEPDMVPEFSTAAFKLDVNQISEPVKSQFGWHLIQVTDKGGLNELSEKNPEEPSIKKQLLKLGQAEIIKIINQKTTEQEQKTPIKYYSLD